MMMVVLVAAPFYYRQEKKNIQGDGRRPVHDHGVRLHGHAFELNAVDGTELGAVGAPLHKLKRGILEQVLTCARHKGE